MIPQIRTLSGLDNDADGICETQTPTEAGYLDLDGILVSDDGTVTLAVAQKLSIASAGNDTGVTFTVTGRDESRLVEITEVITGANTATATSTTYWKSISSIYVSGATADAVTVGVLKANGGVSSMIVCDNRVNGGNFNIGMGVNITGTLNATVQQCFDNIFDQTITPTWTNTLGLTAITATDKGNIAYAVRAVRLKLNTWTSGSVTLNLIQAG